MRRNVKIILVAIILLAVITTTSAYFILTPHYKTIEMNGYKLEVPESNSTVESINDNYKTYTDEKNNITIKSYAINNINESNYIGASDIGEQIKTNNGTNTTIANRSVANKSGTYTYYELDAYQMIVITAKDKDLMEHMLKSNNKTEIKVDETDIDLLAQLNVENTSDNTTLSNTTNKSSTTTSNKKSSSKISSSGSKSKSSSSGSEDAPLFVVNPKTGKREYGRGHPNYGTSNDYLQSQHRR